MARNNSENTRVNSEVLDNARSYCFGTGRILQKFIDTAITNELKRCKPTVIVSDSEEEMHSINDERIEPEVEKGNGW